MPKQISAKTVERLSPANIVRVIFGVRYEPQYGLMDRIGTAIDAVLREEGTPFGPETFPLSQVDANEHVLINPDTEAVLRVNYQDAILQLPTDTRQFEPVSQFAEDFQAYVLRPLREIGKVRNVARHGVVLYFDDASATLRNPPITRYVAPDFPDARNLFMRFSRRLASMEALVKKRVDDYRNVNYKLEESEDGRLRISVDYQEYFRPPLDAGEWNERPFTKTAERALQYFKGEFQTWFAKLAGVSEVA